MKYEIIYSACEAAQRLKRSERHIKRLVKDGKLKHFREGREYRFAEEHIVAYLESLEVA